MSTMIKQESNVQLNVKWNEYIYIMHGFKAFIEMLDAKTGQSHEELWKIYNKMYMTRQVKDKWYNKGE